MASRLSFAKSPSKSSITSSVLAPDLPIPRSKSSHLLRGKKKSVSNGMAGTPESGTNNRLSTHSAHLEPFVMNYSCDEELEEGPEK